MTKKDKAKKRDKDYKQKQSDMLKEQSAKDINQRYRDGTLWDKKK